MNVTELYITCKQNTSCTMCWKTSNKKCPHFIQKTNADKIRSMSDDELANIKPGTFWSQRMVGVPKKHNGQLDVVFALKEKGFI